MSIEFYDVLLSHILSFIDHNTHDACYYPYKPQVGTQWPKSLKFDILAYNSSTYGYQSAIVLVYTSVCLSSGSACQVSKRKHDLIAFYRPNMAQKWQKFETFISQKNMWFSDIGVFEYFLIFLNSFLMTYDVMGIFETTFWPHLLIWKSRDTWGHQATVINLCIVS